MAHSALAPRDAPVTSARANEFAVLTSGAKLGIGEAWRIAHRQIDRLDARLLVEHVSGCTHADLIAHPEKLLSGGQLGTLLALLERRASGEPLAYLLGWTDFFGFRFRITSAVLVPRPETELLVELAADRLRSRPRAQVLDLGTGSGAVAVTLARLSSAARLTAVDLSPAALAVAGGNAERHAVKVDFLLGDWFAPIGKRRFDLVVANPPYIRHGDPHLQGDGLTFEPPMALTDGVPDGDGLACIRRITGDSAAHLRIGGWLLIEHGYDQAAIVRGLLRQAGLSDVSSWPDLSGIERVSGGRLR